MSSVLNKKIGGFLYPPISDFLQSKVYIYTNVEIPIFVASQVVKNKDLFAVLSDFTIFVSVFMHKCV